MSGLPTVSVHPTRGALRGAGRVVLGAYLGFVLLLPFLHQCREHDREPAPSNARASWVAGDAGHAAADLCPACRWEREAQARAVDPTLLQTAVRPLTRRALPAEYTRLAVPERPAAPRAPPSA